MSTILTTVYVTGASFTFLVHYGDAFLGGVLSGKFPGLRYMGESLLFALAWPLLPLYFVVLYKLDRTHE